VRWVNDRGGVNGGKVDLRVYDDGADPARHRAQVQEAIEKEHVIAFVSDAGTPTASEASIDYITSKRVPVIGTDTGSQVIYRSPMYFPQAPTGYGMFYSTVASVAPRAIAQGKRKIGTLVCELTQCADVERLTRKWAPGLGLDPVYSARASVAQPDFTAVCLAARSAEVETLFVAMDTNSVPRLASSCARQGYRPLIAIFGPMVSTSHATDRNLEGLMSGANFMPWFQATTPASQEFTHAVQRYAPSVVASATRAGGWVSGKLFEKAAASLSEPPTSEALLQGLWKIKGETLGDITQPLTFLEERPAPQDVVCWWDLVVKEQEWSSADGFERHCGNLP
jgi:branched-chain amino acid transport system substrate-binding protein